MTTLRALRDRIAAATGPDRELDAAITRWLGYAPSEGGFFMRRGLVPPEPSPPWTASRDAVADLAERLLPGRACTIIRHADGSWRCGRFRAPTEPLARLAALVDAMIEEKGADRGADQAE